MTARQLTPGQLEDIREKLADYQAQHPNLGDWTISTVQHLLEHIEALSTETERLTNALRAMAVGRCVGHTDHPKGSPSCPYRTPEAYARDVLGGLVPEPPPIEAAEPGWRNGPWAYIADLRKNPDSASIECQAVLSGRWKPLSDKYWDSCVIKVPWRTRQP